MGKFTSAGSGDFTPAHNMNYPGSPFAAEYGLPEDKRLSRVVRKLLFDAAPQQFYDLALLGLQSPETKNDDVFEYSQYGWQRHPIMLTAAAAGGAITETLSVVDATKVSKDFVLKYPDGTSAVVIDVNINAQTVTVKALDGAPVLPALAITDTLALEGPVDGDRAEDFNSYTSIDITTSDNYVQLFSFALEYGRLELHKLMKNGVFENYLTADMQNMFNQYRISASNMFWTGKKGKVTVGNQQRKLMGGVYHSMLEAGSHISSCDVSTIRDGFESAVDNSEYGDYGAVRFAFAEQTLLRELSVAYKDEKTRYTPESKTVDLMLDMVKLGGSNVVLVPYPRFRDNASFPTFFRDTIFILDMKNIKPVEIWGESSGELTNEERGKGGRKAKKTYYVEGSMSLQFDNPLSCAMVQVDR